jgi:hypothetical protein
MEIRSVDGGFEVGEVLERMVMKLSVYLGACLCFFILVLQENIKFRMY